MSARKFVPFGALCLLGAVGFGLAGCGGGSSNPNTISHVRAFNAVNGVTGNAINVAERNATAYIPNGQNIAYATMSKYGSVGADNVNAINIIATSTASPTTTVATGNYTQTNGFYYTLVAAGVVGATDTTAPKVYQFVDEIPSTQIGNTLAAVRFIDAAPGTAALNVYNDTNGSAVVNGLNNIAYGNASTSSGTGMFNGYVTFTPGTYKFTLRDNTATVVPTAGTALNAVVLKAGVAYTIIAYGVPGGTPAFDAVIVQDFPFL